jgi:hypothetical protein
LRIATATAMKNDHLNNQRSDDRHLHTELKFSELFMLSLTRNSRVEEDLIDQLLIQARSDSCAPSSSRAFRKRRRTSAYFSGYQSGNIGRDD